MSQPQNATVAGESIAGDLNWRRPLWEDFYPRIRREASAEEAARIVVRHLRERVTIAALANPPREVRDIWLQQITDETGFEIIYVAALRAVGVPARLDSNQRAELWEGSRPHQIPLGTASAQLNCGWMRIFGGAPRSPH